MPSTSNQAKTKSSKSTDKGPIDPNDETTDDDERPGGKSDKSVFQHFLQVGRDGLTNIQKCRHCSLVILIL